eukprot:6178583-Amphidinium_carterae.3
MGLTPCLSGLPISTTRVARQSGSMASRSQSAMTCSSRRLCSSGKRDHVFTFQPSPPGAFFPGYCVTTALVWPGLGVRAARVVARATTKTVRDVPTPLHPSVAPRFRQGHRDSASFVWPSASALLSTASSTACHQARPPARSVVWSVRGQCAPSARCCCAALVLGLVVEFCVRDRALL